MPAGLFFVFALSGGRFPHRLLVRHLRRMNIHLDPVFALEFLKCDIHVKLTHSAQDHLMGLIISREFQRGIFLDEFVQT